MKKVKLGELVINRKVWVRERTSLDHIRCLVNDLINGAKFPPLKVDRETGIIVGGVHRYEAYKLFYGNGWEDREIEIDFLDLPPLKRTLLRGMPPPSRTMSIWRNGWAMGTEQDRCEYL